MVQVFFSLPPPKNLYDLISEKLLNSEYLFLFVSLWGNWFSGQGEPLISEGDFLFGLILNGGVTLKLSHSEIFKNWKE
jgi:hypothetical protein